MALGDDCREAILSARCPSSSTSDRASASTRRTLSHEWVRFDAPATSSSASVRTSSRSTGSTRRCCSGGTSTRTSPAHVPSARAVESLEDRVAGYHCNHSRTPTVYGPDAVGNDLARFFTSVEQAELPGQRETWGLADVTLEEIPVRARVGRRFADALVTAIPPDGVRLAPNVGHAPVVDIRLQPRVSVRRRFDRRVAAAHDRGLSGSQPDAADDARSTRQRGRCRPHSRRDRGRQRSPRGTNSPTRSTCWWSTSGSTSESFLRSVITSIPT